MAPDRAASERPALADDHGLLVRRLVEPDQLRALAHPRRMDLIDLLMVDGPLTASQCAQRLGDSAASCSYHLRQLARFGFVEEAPGGTGRERPWRRVPLGNRIESAVTPSQQAAAEALFDVIDERNAVRVRSYRARSGTDPWRDESGSGDWAVRITREELRELGEAVHALVAPYQQRTLDGVAPEGSRLVDVIHHHLPRPDAPGTDADG